MISLLLGIEDSKYDWSSCCFVFKDQDLLNKGRTAATTAEKKEQYLDYKKIII